MAKIIKFLLVFSFLLATRGFATSPCQSDQQTWLYTVDTSNQSHIVACLTPSNGAVPWYGFIQPNTSATTVAFDASLGTTQTLTIATNVTSSTLSNAIAGQWMFFTIKEDGAGGHTFQQPANFVNWAAIDTTAGATTTEAGYFDGTYFQVISGGSRGGSCLAGASLTQYVDSAAGNDSNAGTNWCSAKATEGAAVTALGANGGWVYDAPNYTGAAATGVPTNVHILRTNQNDAFRSTAERFSFPDWTDVTEDHHAFASNSDATLADAHTAYTAIGPFSLLALTSSVLGNTTVPAGAAQANSEQAGVAGIITNKSSLDLAQSDGVLGMCYNDGSLGLDCSGVVAAAGNAAGAGSDGSFEALWANLSLAGTASDATGLVIRATGGHMPTAEIGTFSGRPNAAIDIAYGGAAGDSFPTGIFFENSVVGDHPITFTGNYNTLNPHTDVYTYNRWHDYYSASTPYDDLSVVKINNAAIASRGAYWPGNYIFENSANSSEVVLPINHTGTVKVEGVNPVAYSATPTFDRALGSVQTITLTGNVSSSTLQNCVAGQTIILDIIEDGSGAHTFSAPANLHGVGSINTTASYHNRQMFYCDGSSSNSGGYSVSTMQSGT